MLAKKLLFSIIIPVKEINDYLQKETIPAILNQTYRNFEIIILPDRKARGKFPKTRIVPSWPKLGPADKRDLGAKKARGEILAFLDDDSYPVEDWLSNALKIFASKSLNSLLIAGVCGPTLTPPNDNLRQKASGYVWSTFLGSGGTGNYRCSVKPRREVDDYPSVNLLIRKKDFLAVGGFNSKFWPGEDTKLCHDLVYKLGKKIIYDPKILVYHHRREIFGPHLRQISRYALHRGHFARIIPKTSFRLGYLLPTFFVLELGGGLVIIFLAKKMRFYFLGNLFIWFYLGVIGFYLLALFFTAWDVNRQEKNWKVALLVIPAILATHLVYGILFIKGFLTSRLESMYSR